MADKTNLLFLKNKKLIEAMRQVFKFLIRLSLTPVLIAIAIAISILYALLGLIMVPIQVIRYLALITISSLRSAFSKIDEDYPNKFMDALYEFIKNYIALFFTFLIKLPLSIWNSGGQEPKTSNLKLLFDYQLDVLNYNWITTIIVFLSLILSFAFSTSILGLKGITFFGLNGYQWQNKYLYGNTYNLNDRFMDKYTTNLSSSEILDIKRQYSFQLSIGYDSIITLKNKQLDELSNRLEGTPYGEGYGKLVVFLNRDLRGKKVEIAIDGTCAGKLDRVYIGEDPCNAPLNEKLVKILPAGQHKIYAKIIGNYHVWHDQVVEIKENECTPWNFSYKN